jgi:energy-converting hydrogenase Eha subunit H
MEIPLNVPVLVSLNGGVSAVGVIRSTSDIKQDTILVTLVGLAADGCILSDPASPHLYAKFECGTVAITPVDIKDLPLYLGYKYVWPLLGEIIKEGRLPNNYE